MPDPRASGATATGADTIPGTTIRFFLSSTFVDFQTERETGVVCAVRRFVGSPVGPAVAIYAAQDEERAERVLKQHVLLSVA